MASTSEEKHSEAMKMHMTSMVRTSMRAQPKVFLRVPSRSCESEDGTASGDAAEVAGASRSLTSSTAFFLDSIAGLPRKGDFIFWGLCKGSIENHYRNGELKIDLL